MTVERPESAVLRGRYISLAPLTEEHLPELFRAIAVPEVFAGGYGGGPAALPKDAGSFTAWANAYIQWGGLPFAVRIEGGPEHGLVIGTTTLGDIEASSESAHIGWTAYSPAVWGSAVNAEAKLLLLGLAFDNGFGRVKIQADAANDRSRAAIVRLGAQFEGVLRRHKPRADGSWRDTAVYSVLADEWPAVRVGLQERLEAFNGEPVQPRVATA